MRIYTTLIASLALALATGACSKNHGSSSEAETAGGTETGAAKAESPDHTTATDKSDDSAEDKPEEPAAGEVHAATADDLPRFTEDLEGDGPLMATIETSMGDFHCELYEKGAPLTVANFVGLARGLLAWKDPKTGEVVKRPLYDGLTFHRVIPGFMIQGGDPLGNGTGGPGFKYATEVSDQLRHDKPGIMSMANAGPNTNGSQFFITEAAKPHLDGSYNVFGHCKDAEDLVKKIARVPTGARNKPVDPVIIKRVTISRGK